MTVITSADNSTVKHVNSLLQKKYRDKSGEFIVEGYKNTLDTVSAYGGLKTVCISESAYTEHGREFPQEKTVVISDEVFEKMGEAQHGQGVIAVFYKKRSEMPIGERAILLDGVRDPGNVGTVIRTACACGYDVILNNCADVYSPKVVRSAMSAVVKCRISFDLSPDVIKASGYELIVSDMGGESVFCAKPSKKYCIVIGNEAHGVSDSFLSAADRTLCLPQDNIESLNASVAAGVMMYTLRYCNAAK